jgi:hypothetical protein
MQQVSNTAQEQEFFSEVQNAFDAFSSKYEKPRSKFACT